MSRYVSAIVAFSVIMLGGNLVFWHFENKGGIFESPLVNFLEKNISKSNRNIIWNNLSGLKNKASLLLVSFDRNGTVVDSKKNQSVISESKKDDFVSREQLVLLKKGKLNIRVLGCSSPVVEIIDTNQKYYPGIILNPGCYWVKVSKIGYRTVALYACLEIGENKVETINLIKNR